MARLADDRGRRVRDRARRCSLPFLLVNADAVKFAYRSWWNSGASYGSLWLVPLALPSDPARAGWPGSVWTRRSFAPGTVTTLALLGMVLAVRRRAS